MPLNANLPAIDNRRFDEIVTEARTRIARYTPEWAAVWTDLNDSDPGITLVQLFAWMTELLIYRLGNVPEQNYLKFLELIGIELNPATPAHAQISFPVAPNAPDPYVIVPLHTQVTAPDPSGGPPIVFETDAAIYALRATLAGLLSYDGYAFSDVSSPNNDAQGGFQPFGPNAASGAAFYLGFTDASPLPPVELDLDVWVMQQPGSASSNNCNLPLSQVYPPVQIVWQYWTVTGWSALDFLQDDTIAFQRSGHIALRPPDKGMGLGTFLSVGPMYWIRAMIQSGGYEKPPQLLAVRTNTVSATQAQTVQSEVVGGSDGRPNQTFTLANNPILDGTLELQVDEGDGPADWSPVADFYGSGPNDRVYVLDRTTGSIRFGDGTNGAIPVANVDHPDDNIIAATYRYGGGKQGNVLKNTLTTLLTSISGIDESKVTNIFDAFGGQDEETLDEAKIRAPRALKSRCRAVTEDDFVYLATQAGNVKRAFAMPLTNPAFPGVDVPGSVTVIIVPDADPSVPNPTPSDGLIRTVCAYLNLRRLITTELYVIPPKYQLVRTNVTLVAANSADLAIVKKAVETSLTDYFHPLRGGEKGQGWPFGGTIYYSRVYQRIMRVPGVDRISSLTITLAGLQYPACQDVPIASSALLYSTGHDVQVNYSFG